MLWHFFLTLHVHLQVNVARNRVQIWTVEDAQEPNLTTSDVS